MEQHRPIYPCLEIDLAGIRRNACAMAALCASHGISVAGVIKFADGNAEIARAYHEGGCAQIAASRPAQLRDVKHALPRAQTMLVRLPMPCEAEETVRWCDISLNSSRETLLALDAQARTQRRRHGVVLLLEAGDLREGVPDADSLCALACAVEAGMPGLHLLGVGSTFSCFGAILPDKTNLSALVAAAERVETAIGRRLALISGGSSTSLLPLLAGDMPARVNHLRIGGTIANPMGMRLNRGVTIPGMREDTCLLRAQLIEANRKPSRPFGTSSLNWAGESVQFPDLGIRKRGILALGAADVGDVFKLIPTDARVKILGGSSDHLVVDLDDCGEEYAVGSELTFRMFYGPLLYAFSGRHVAIRYVER